MLLPVPELMYWGDFSQCKQVGSVLYYCLAYNNLSEAVITGTAIVGILGHVHQIRTSETDDLLTELRPKAPH